MLFRSLASYTIQYNPQSTFILQTGFPAQPFPIRHFPCSTTSGTPKTPGEGPSRSSTPQSVGVRDQASPPLFQASPPLSRCSSPLQLNLLQVEESQRSMERQDGTVLSGGAQRNNAVGEKGGKCNEKELQKVRLVA